MEIFVNSLFWLLIAVITGFIISLVFSNFMKLSRNVFLIPYIILVAAFLFAFFYCNHIDPGGLLYFHWLFGLIAGIIVGVFLIGNVYSQPASRTSTGRKLVIEIIWMGLAYGIIDALFLNVMPVFVVWMAFGSIECTYSWQGKILIGIIALIASLLVTLTYHLGYSEFRNKKIMLVLLGNTLISLAYIISGNPMGAIISHTAMHVAAVTRGPETTLQLPPHKKL